jgi:hypothetical protein
MFFALRTDRRAVDTVTPLSARIAALAQPTFCISSFTPTDLSPAKHFLEFGAGDAQVHGGGYCTRADQLMRETITVRRTELQPGVIA